MLGVPNSLPKQRQAVAVRRGQPRIDNTNDTRKVINPLNWTTNYPGGMQQEWDNTPGYERTRFVYPNGSYDQINADGAHTTVSVGNRFEYHKGGTTISVDQNGDVTIKGHQRMNIEGGQHMEVRGNVDMVVTGHMTEVVTGNKDSYVFGNHNITVSGTHSINAGKGYVAYSPQTMVTQGDAGVLTASNGDIHNKSVKLFHNSKDVGDDHKHTEVLTGGDITGVPV